MRKIQNLNTEQAARNSWAKRSLSIILVCVALLIAFLSVGRLAQQTGPDPAATASATPDSEQPDDQAAEISRRTAKDPMAIGNLDAPIVLTEWTDLRCPFCAAFHRDTMPLIESDFVEQGLVRIEIRDVAFFGEQSESAAVAARAAGRQGKYFEYLDAVYQSAPARSHPDLPREKLVEFAQQADVDDLEKFTADLSDDSLRAEVQQSTTEAQELGVSSVPFFVAGNTALSGAQPSEVFTDFLHNAVDQGRR
ncbi:DsbA family protein [Glutamicibacter sp. JL.03c]|uniref:DsbA family protein n=1 Tax=Glutamicibacter sp. JL.03c TaxID=2984842 RepID=UPI0021F73868|nr:DsbA family protein [Glutamicibacter sp. JL.03c]UYQ77733.1 DsbA family protein [Glutamicibacter sp. JL.03c]